MRRCTSSPIDPPTHAIHRPDRRRQSQAKRGKRALAIEQFERRVLLSPAPMVTSIDRATPVGQYTSATSVDYTVTFSQTVTGVDPTDFKVITDGSLQAQTPVAVSGSGSSYTVQVNGLSGSGDLQLDLIDDDSIENGSNTPWAARGWTTAASRARPTPSTRPTPSSSRSTAPHPAHRHHQRQHRRLHRHLQRARHRRRPHRLRPRHHRHHRRQHLTQVTPVSSSVYTVTVGGITGSGTLGLNLVDNGTIHDLAGNPLAQTNGAATFATQATLRHGHATRTPWRWRT